MSQETGARALRFSYNTNGFAHHRLPDAISILSTLGYDGIALTLDWHHLDPLTASGGEIENLRALLATTGLGVVIETGARYLLDPWRKHEPTLISFEGRERRLEYLRRAVDVAQALEAEAVSFFSGRLPDGLDPAKAREWLVAGCRELACYAEAAGVSLALEPEPGMLIETLGSAMLVIREVLSPSLGLALDVGHVRCAETISEVEAIETYAPWIRAIHIEDIAGREHVHLMFGEGDLAFEPILEALVRAGYTGLVSVELSRDSHRAPEAARDALAFLRARMPRPS